MAWLAPHGSAPSAGLLQISRRAVDYLLASGPGRRAIALALPATMTGRGYSVRLFPQWSLSTYDTKPRATAPQQSNRTVPAAFQTALPDLK